MVSNTQSGNSPLKGSLSLDKNVSLIFGVVIVAVVAFVAIFLISNNQPSSFLSEGELSNIPQERLADGGFVLGDPNARVTVIEFADYACSHCHEYKPTIDRFINEYVKTGKARFEYRVFPTAGGDTTVFFGTIAVCMEEQKKGAYWLASDLFTQKAIQGNYGQNTGREVATEIGVDYNQALGCSQNQEQVNTDRQLGATIGVHGTPAVAVRIGDSAPQWITFNGRTYDQGGPPFEALVFAVTLGGA